MSSTPPRKGSSDERDKKVIARLKEGGLPEFTASSEEDWQDYFKSHELGYFDLMSLFRELSNELSNSTDKEKTDRLTAIKTIVKEKMDQIKAVRVMGGRLTPPTADTLSSPQSGRSSPLSPLSFGRVSPTSSRSPSPASTGRVSPASSSSGRISPASSEMRLIPSIEEWQTDPDPLNPNKPTRRAHYMQLHEKQIKNVKSKEELSRYMLMLGEEDWNIGFLIFVNKLVRNKCSEKEWGENIKFDRQILESAGPVVQSFNREQLINFMKYLGKWELKGLELGTLSTLNDLIKKQCAVLNSKDKENQPLTFDLEEVIKEKQAEIEEASTQGKTRPRK